MNVQEICHRVGAWRYKNFGKQTRYRNLAQIMEEIGEVARAVGKEDEGIRPETRGSIPDELGDVLIAVCGMIIAEGYDVDAIVRRRLEWMESLDFTKDKEAGHGNVR